MSAKLSRLSQRLARIEQQLIELEVTEQIVNCNCRRTTVFHNRSPEEIEAEKNRPCPAHGVRQLGQIVIIEYLGRPDTRRQLRERLLANDPAVGGFCGKGTPQEPPPSSNSSS